MPMNPEQRQKRIQERIDNGQLKFKNFAHGTVQGYNIGCRCSQCAPTRSHVSQKNTQQKLQRKAQQNSAQQKAGKKGRKR